MAEFLIQDTTLDAIADAINAKTGGSSAMTPAQMVTEIASISGGGVIHEQYAHAEDWLTTNAGGNTLNFYNTYIANIPSNTIYAIYINNNGITGSGAANVVCGTKYTRTKFAFWRTTVADTAANNYDFFISSGSIIDIYYIVVS